MSRRAGPLLVMVAVTVAMSVALPAGAEIVVQNGFEDETWTEGMIDVRSLDLSRTNVIGGGFAGNGLRVVIPEGGFRGLGPLDRLEPAPREAWYRYHIRLLSWNAAFVGKLPGLAGLYSSSGRGCIPPTESSPGWSARGLFGSPGTEGAPAGRIPIGTYLYHADQPGDCGEHLWWPGASLQQGRWHCIEGHVTLNDPWARNGAFQGWLDGKLRFSKQNIAYRSPGEANIRIRHMWHNVYFGGDWPSPNRLSLVFDQVAVSTDGRIGCMDPFKDDNGSIFKPALSELHARGLLYGCGYRLACPDRTITRGEAAAFFHRVLGLPATGRDFFIDDGNSIFEGAINRLAAAGIVRGCEERRFCPDRNLTRAEFAAMTVRALDLPRDNADAFSDDNRHWAESAIDAFAAAGITKGCGSDAFCPDRRLTRGEASAFFVRVDDLNQPIGLASVPSPPEYPPPGDPPPIPPEEQD
ncbi:MAG TPA: S-layer homology domain-containing protein [Acidimicrobiia bacterium]|nr:S-layer homology domain-containing protein [Acidimicrobiia bacterium]